MNDTNMAAIVIPVQPQGTNARLQMNNLLHGILKTIIRLPWLHADAGGIFLADPVNRRLELAAHLNFTPQIQGACARVAFGHCLCGCVAESGELLHVGCVDHRHETRYEGMADHGHYVVPIRDGGDLLGVLTLYVEAGHQYREDEAEALRDFATTPGAGHPAEPLAT